MRAMFALIPVLLAMQLASASAQDHWREFRSQSDGFSIALPQTPTITSRRIGSSDATQTIFLIESGPASYLVSVIALPKGKGPKSPDNAYFQARIKDYASGSGTTLRSSRMTTVAGRPAIEGITDAPERTHLVQVLVDGDRLVMMVYSGPKGQEKGADSTRFHESLKLVN